MSTAEHNPFDSPRGLRKPKEAWKLRPILCHTSAVVILVLAALPALYVLLILYSHYVGLSANPSTSYRPLVFVIAIPLSFFAAIVVGTLSAILNAFGDELDKGITALAMSLTMLPFLLGFFGPLVICILTGSSLGS